MANLCLKGPVQESVIFGKVQNEQELAIAEKVKVGCVIEGWRKGITHMETEYFGGANIELSKTYVYHAEMVALTDCIMNRYWPVRLYVSSQSMDEDTFLCGDCRQQLLEVNSNCVVIVFNPDGTRKGMFPVSKLLPKHKDVTEKNKKYYELLYG